MNRLSLGSMLLFLVGCGEGLAGAFLTALPGVHLAPAQASLDEVRRFSSPVADWMLHASLDETFELVLIGLTTAVIARTAYRRGESWSWYTLAVLTVGYCFGSIAIHFATISGQILLRDPAFLSLFLSLLVSLVALGLSYQSFFPISTGAEMAAH